MWAQFSRDATPSKRNEGAIDYLRRVHQQFLPFGNDGTEADRPAQYDVLDAKPTPHPWARTGPCATVKFDPPRLARDGADP